MPGFILPFSTPLSWQSPLAAQFWSSADRRIYARLYVGRPDGYTWVDLMDYLVSARVRRGDVSAIGTGQSGADSVVQQMDLELLAEGSMMPAWPDTLAVDENHVIGDETAVLADEADGVEVVINAIFATQNAWARDSFAPRDRTSAWNQFGGVYAPLLWPNREVILDVAAVPLGQTPGAADWVRLFHGYMGDSIQASSDRGRISIQCRDQAKRLQDTYIETVRQYGSDSGTPAEMVIQQILDDNLGAGVVQLYCSVSPGFMVRPYQVEYQSVWDAIQAVAQQIGWFLGYRWWPDVNDFRLTLMAPPREKDSTQYDFLLDWTDDIYVQELDITDRDVRNAVKVTYRDKATGQRASVTVEDAASIAEYGRRAMQVEEADTSLIDTAAEATAFAQAALHDLKDLTGTTRLTLPLMPTLDVFAGVLVTNPRLSSTQDFFAVESVEHTLDWEGKRFRTEAVCSGRVVGSHTRWLEMQTRPGAAGQPVTGGSIAPSSITSDRAAAESFLTIHESGIFNMPRGPQLDGSFQQKVAISGQSGTNDLILQQTGIPVTGGTAYTASAAVSASVTNKVKLEIVEKNSSGTILATHVSGTVIDPQDFQLLWVSFITVPSTTTIDFNVRGLNATSEWMQVDCAQVNSGSVVNPFVSGSGNLVANPSFETDTNTDGLADSWSVIAPSITWAASRVDNGNVGTGFSILKVPLAVPLSFKPIVIGEFLSNNPPASGEVNQLFYTFYGIWNSTKSRNDMYSWGALVGCDGTNVACYNAYNFPISVRYYVLREEAFS